MKSDRQKREESLRQTCYGEMHQETEALSPWNEHEILRKEANKNRLSYSTVQTEKSVGLQTPKGRHIHSSRRYSRVYILCLVDQPNLTQSYLLTYLVLLEQLTGFIVSPCIFHLQSVNISN
jgi:hypothetical protein